VEFLYPYVAEDGRENQQASPQVLRVVRGGAFSFDAGLVRCAFRGWHHPGDLRGFLGFRVVLSPFRPDL
jgi:formylglycine-generating enzyme required for sulfatase activity